MKSRAMLGVAVSLAGFALTFSVSPESLTAEMLGHQEPTLQAANCTGWLGILGEGVKFLPDSPTGIFDTMWSSNFVDETNYAFSSLIVRPGLIRVRAEAKRHHEAYQPAGGGYGAIARGGFFEELRLDPPWYRPDLRGGLGSLTFFFDVGGTAMAPDPNLQGAWAEATVLLDVDVSTSWGYFSDHQEFGIRSGVRTGEMRSFSKTITVVYGEPFSLEVSARTDATASTQYTPGSLPSTVDITATADFTKTFKWGGVIEVRDSLGNLVTDYTLTSGSGADYTKPIVVGPTITSCAPAQAADAVNGQATVPDFTQQLVVASNGAMNLTVTQDPPAGTLVGAGTTTVTLTVTDEFGDSASCSTSFDANDTASPEDRAAPVITCAAPDGLWHNANVNISCTASDSGSGLANAADASFTLATSVAAGQENSNYATGSRSVCDAAGNCATAGPIAGNRIDRKPPVIAISSPAATSYTFAQAVNAAFTCTDGGAGTASCAGTSPNGSVINTASVGTKTFTVSASDAAGNAATVSVNYAVSPLPVSPTVVLAPASPQYSDRTTVTVTLPVVAGSSPATSMTVTAGGQSAGPVSFSASGSTITATASLGPLPLAPGSYPLSISFGGVNANFALPAYSSSLAIGKEDARATYAGTLFAATSSTSSNAATVVLSATIQDMTAVDPSDSNPGDVRNAKVTFVNRDTTPPTVLCANLPVGLVNSADLKTGTATCNWSANIGAADSNSFTIGIVVDGHYTRNDSNDNPVVTVSRPYPTSFITGGGYLLLAQSAGLTAGDVNSRANFGFNVKYNKSGTNLQGRINAIVRRQGRVYQIKGNSMTSLSALPATVGGKATFTGKASITDITNPLVPLAVDGNATLQVTTSDNGEPGNTDAIGITVWNKSGGLWFSSTWTGTATVEQVLAGGNLVVR